MGRVVSRNLDGTGASPGHQLRHRCPVSSTAACHSYYCCTHGAVSIASEHRCKGSALHSPLELAPCTVAGAGHRFCECTSKNIISERDSPSCARALCLKRPPLAAMLWAPQNFRNATGLRHAANLTACSSQICDSRVHRCTHYSCHRRVRCNTPKLSRRRAGQADRGVMSYRKTAQHNHRPAPHRGSCWLLDLTHCPGPSLAFVDHEGSLSSLELAELQ